MGRMAPHKYNQTLTLMNFNVEKPIYLQIADAVCARVLAGELKAEERIQSVREYGAELGVNPNTMARSYEKLTADGVIYNKRGIGFFIAPEARDLILKRMKSDFQEREVPEIKAKLKLLGLDYTVFKD